MKKLTKTQLQKLDKIHDKTHIENLKNKLLEKERSIKSLKQEILKYQIKLIEIEQKDINIEINNSKNKKNKLKKELKEEIEKIKEYHKIKGPLGYNPENGEIKED